MFTGIVTDIGTLREATMREHGKLRRLVIETAYDPDTIAIGASIACSGICLTVVERGRTGNASWFAVDTAAETLAVTTAGDWAAGSRLNLERSLSVGDELGGHIVSGHVDGIATILSREAVGGEDPWSASVKLVMEAPSDLARFIAVKGSVALDGTSLTVNTVEGARFSVLLIPHTMSVTTWADRRAGDRVNIEVDMMARYAARLAEARALGY